MPNTTPAAVADRDPVREILVELTNAVAGLVVDTTRDRNAFADTRFRINDALRAYDAASRRTPPHQPQPSAAPAADGARALTQRDVSALRENIDRWFYGENLLGARIQMVGLPLDVAKALLATVGSLPTEPARPAAAGALVALAPDVPRGPSHGAR